MFRAIFPAFHFLKEEVMKGKILSTVSIFSFLATLLFISACISDIPIPDETPQDEYAIDNLPGCEDCPYELDEAILAELVNLIEEGEYGNIHSLLVIHNDSLVVEEYFRAWTRHMRPPLHSVTKSITSALIGIAMDQGKIDGVDEKLLSFFSEYDDIANLDARKESITLENVLTMSTGFTWNEWGIPYEDIFGIPNFQNDLNKIIMSRDWIKYVLDLSMSDDPGTKWNYNSGGSHLLSGIISNKTGQSAEEFAEENLFNALGITNWEWESDPNGISKGGWGLYLHPANMAMFGYLYLKNGILNGEQVISENWVKESTAKQIAYEDPDTGEHTADYGYQWWRHTDNTVEGYLKINDLFAATGSHGQRIYIIPHLNMVAVITAGNIREGSYSPVHKILFDYILSAVKEK